MKSNQIYFVQATNGLVKIGKSNAPGKRVKELQIGSPLELKIKRVISGGLYLESILHLYFKHLHKHGEWFKPDTELSLFINGKRNISISVIIDVVYDKLSKSKQKYIRSLENKRLYI